MYGEHFGPGRASRAIAIVHIAMFDAMNAIEAGYSSYTLPTGRYRLASTRAALAQAAHDTVAMYPSQRSIFARELRKGLRLLRHHDSRWGARVFVGGEVARTIAGPRVFTPGRQRTQATAARPPR